MSLSIVRGIGQVGLFKLAILRASKPDRAFRAELVRQIYAIGARTLRKRPSIVCKVSGACAIHFCAGCAKLISANTSAAITALVVTRLPINRGKCSVRSSTLTTGDSSSESSNAKTIGIRRSWARKHTPMTSRIYTTNRLRLSVRRVTRLDAMGCLACGELRASIIAQERILVIVLEDASIVRLPSRRDLPAVSAKRGALLQKGAGKCPSWTDPCSRFRRKLCCQILRTPCAAIGYRLC